VRVPPGEGSVDIDLILAATGSIEGVVTRAGKPLPDTVIIATPVGATSANFFVVSGPDGTFALDAVAPGTYVVYAMIGGGGGAPKQMHVTAAEVVVGQRVKAAIDATPGDVAVTVEVVTDAGAPVPVAQLMLLQAEVDGATMDQLRDGSWLPEHMRDGGSLTMYMRTLMGGPEEIVGVEAGKHTACVVPIPVTDPSQMQGMREEIERLPMKCTPVDVKARPAAQRARVTVPAAWLEPPR
jgi:hypothetical protein